MSSVKIVVLLIQLKFVLTAPCGNYSTECIKHTLQDNNSTGLTTHPNETIPVNQMGENVSALSGSQDILFPDSFELLFKQITPIQGVPNCADGLSLCEDVATYPYKRLRETLAKTEQHKDFFGVDETLIDFANRVGESDENFICASIETTIFPKAGKNKNNKWKYIINQGETEGHIQGIRIEKCTQFNGSCNLVSDAPVGYVTSCKQKYVLRRLLSLTDNGQPVPDSFQIPSACCCGFKKDLNFLQSFGRSVTPSV